MNWFLNGDREGKISLLRPLSWASLSLMGFALTPDAAMAGSNEAYGLVIEVHASHTEGDLAGLTTYRMYLSTPNDNDVISAMYGDDELPLFIETSTSFHQDPVASEVLGSQMNPAFFMFYPDMAFDSWLTIGLDGPPSEDEGEPLTIGNSNNHWETNFEAGGNVVMADAIGGSVFILNAPNITNNISGEDHRILLGQFTTDGELEGQVNVQMFTQGVIHPSDRMTIPFSGVGLHPASLLDPCGCMDETACNYNPLADCDDGSCIAVDAEAPAWTYFPPDDTIACDEMMPTIEETMPIASDDCAGVEVVWVGDGPFDYPFGCLQSYTCPRVYRATDGAGQTLLDTVIISVLDTVAPQFFFPTQHVLSVNEFDGETVPAAEAFVLDDCDTGAAYDVTETSTDMGDGQMVIERIYSTWDGCGNTREFHQTITVTQVVPGCTDDAACNYDPDADEDDGSCVFPGFLCDDEDEMTINEVVGDDCNCVGEPIVNGCMDSSACNFDPSANVDDGSCVEETSGYGLALEALVSHPDTGVLAGMTTYRMYITTPNTNDVISAIYGEEEVPLVISTTTSFFQSEFGGVLGSDVNPAFFQFYPEMQFDSWVTIGLDGPAGPNDQAPSTIGEANNSWETNFEAGMDLLIQDSIGGAIFVTNDGSLNLVSGDDQRILIGQFTTDGSMSGQMNVQMFTEGNVIPGERLNFFFNGVGVFPSAGDNVCGCTDATACNYDSSATFDDGSCEYAESPCTACDGTCLQDSDGDGVCDCLEFPGCTDELACNYDPIYTDDAGNCYYAEPFYDCDGNCLEDSDGDGICDPLEVPGCTDESFCNYNPQATDDDGTCGETDQVNDACTGAFELACGESLLMNNEECANVDDVPGCAAAAPQMSTAGLWFTFEGTGDSVTVTTCLPGTNFDTYLSVYEGTCGELICVAGNDDQSEPAYDDLCLVDDPEDFVASTVTMNTSPETTYWVLVSGVSGESGDFEVGLTCVLPGCIDEAACNYDATANVDDGSCESTSCAGCTDPDASNYDPLATIADDGSCQYCELTLETTSLQGLTCAGDNNAQVALDISNVSEPDSLTVYLDDEEVIGTTFDGLAAGTYTVLVTEGSFCSALVTFTVNEGTSLNVVTQTTDLLCFGDASGLIDATISNGQAPFTFGLSGTASATNANGLFDGLSGGAYVLEVTDANGCTGNADLELSEPEALTLEANITDASAPGTGAIDLTITGGTAPYNVTWTQDGAFVADSENLEGLDGPSSFEVVVVDGNGCEVEGGPYAVSDASGVYDLESVVFQVMPNPATDLLQLQWSDWTEQVDIQIFDASGRTMMQRTLPMQPSWTMDVSAWAAGTYHVQLSSSSGVGHASLVIQR